MTSIAIEHCHRNSRFTHEKWGFAILLLVFQSVAIGIRMMITKWILTSITFGWLQNIKPLLEQLLVNLFVVSILNGLCKPPLNKGKKDSARKESVQLWPVTTSIDLPPTESGVEFQHEESLLHNIKHPPETNV